MNDAQKDAQRKLRWLTKAREVLGDCTCLIDFKARDLLDPNCAWHQHHGELVEALRDEYNLGRIDMRLDWMDRVPGRNGGDGGDGGKGDPDA